MESIDLTEIKKWESLPPVHLWKPAMCGSMDLIIKANGEWWHDGSPIKRPAMVRLFSRILWQEGDRYYLVTPAEKVEIQVEDAPFLVTEWELDHDSQTIILRTSVGDEKRLGEDCDLWMATFEGQQGREQRPYITMRYGMKAMIHRNVFYDLIGLCEERVIDGQSWLCLTSGGKEYPLGCCD